jgi:hypothetical protein
MTIDISQLPREKQAFLKANPELLKSLEDAIPREITRTKLRMEKIKRSHSKLQREIDEAVREAELYRQHYNPILLQVEAAYLKRISVSFEGGELICPICGESPNSNMYSNKGPRGEPWCVKCNSPLIDRKKLAKWVKEPKVKVLGKNFKVTFKEDEK